RADSPRGREPQDRWNSGRAAGRHGHRRGVPRRDEPRHGRPWRSDRACADADVGSFGPPRRHPRPVDPASGSSAHREGRSRDGRVVANGLLTVERRIVAGKVARKGKVAPYRRLAAADGEEHIVRTELSGPPGRDAGRHVRPLLTLAHLTDLHVTDVESPARFEY